MDLSLIYRRVLPPLSFLVMCLSEALAERCDDGSSCTTGMKCCSTGCCFEEDKRYAYSYRLSIWNMWYFWFVVLFILMSCFGGCGYYKQRQRILRNQQGMGPGLLSVFQVTSRRRPGNSRIVTLEPGMYPQQTGYGYSANLDPNPGVNLSPPPYSEVVGNPDLFPATNKEGVPGNQSYSTSSPSGGQSIYSNQAAVDAADQMPQPPPYSEVSNQIPAAHFMANQNHPQMPTSTNQEPDRH